MKIKRAIVIIMVILFMGLDLAKLCAEEDRYFDTFGDPAKSGVALSVNPESIRLRSGLSPELHRRTEKEKYRKQTPMLASHRGSARGASGVFRRVDKRKWMVETQIKARGIKDKKLLGAMLKVERHKFLPPVFRQLAYEDRPLPIGENQTISQPYIVALMTEALELSGDEKVLEIGTGSGYQAAILAELARQVYTIEIIENLANRADSLLKELGYKNIKVKCGDGYLGWPEFSPFDAIIITCAVDTVPEPLIEQLADDGRLVAPVGKEGYQELTLIKKKGKKLEESFITGCLFVPMTGEHIKK